MNIIIKKGNIYAYKYMHGKFLITSIKKGRGAGTELNQTVSSSVKKRNKKNALFCCNRLHLWLKHLMVCETIQNIRWSLTTIEASRSVCLVNYTVAVAFQGTCQLLILNGLHFSHFAICIQPVD